ncbi:acyl-CoA dehydrogenase family protein [Streptomyces sp. NPDC059262]|uniref:acyl-CoA dehydrogenase family protein n=1 Tax=Streptomyces sp. NPDC059262 TaxID=3346797 RepID=UPI0036A0FA5D
MGDADVEHELRESVGGLLDSRCALDAVRALTEEGPGWDEALWAELTEMGVIGLATPEEDGGEGGGMALAVAVQEELGRRLAPAPAWSSLVAQAVLRVADSDVARALLPEVASGAAPATVVTGRGVNGWSVAEPVRATSDASGAWRLDGEAPVVVEALGSRHFLVAARGPDGPRWFVAAGAAVSVRPVLGLDPTRPLSSVEFGATPAQPLCAGDGFEPLLAAARRTALTALAADAVGVANAATRLGVEHAKERRQFGRPIGTFQAVSHRLTDMFVGVETARALVRAAATALDDAAQDGAAPAPDNELDLAVELAASAALDAAVAATQGCVQVHGGMGITWEHPAHSYLRRAKADEALIAWPDRLRDRAAGRIVAAARRRLTTS